MSIRIKVFLIICAIVLAITASSVIISVASAQNHILRTLENDMEKMVEITNENIVTEISALETDASAITHILNGAQPDEVMQVLMEQSLVYPDFQAISIFNSHGQLEASYPWAPPENVVKDKNGITELARRAFEGDKVISSTNQSAAGVVFYVFIPMDDYRIQAITGTRNPNPKIVVFTVDGGFFNERVERYGILKTGYTTILDREGIIIANINEDWVYDQINFLDLAVREEDKKSMSRIIDKETNTGRFSLLNENNEKVDYVIAYTPITSPAVEWELVVLAPVAESSFLEIRGLLIISGLVFFGLGMLAAALASGVIAKPFEIAKELAKAKTTFIANLSHDMRTPLNAVIGFSDLSLTSKKLPPDIAHNLEKIYGTGFNLLGVVNDLLDISNMESGKFGIMAGEYEVPTFINDTIKTNITHIGSKPITFKITPDDDLPMRLVGDGLRLRQVFSNLLANAFNDTSEGTVEWKISTMKEKDSIWLISSVSDTGPGIKPEDIDKVFLDYSNQDSSEKRSLQGAGLNLALTKRMTDLMGGTITVDSTPGKGSTFTVRIPQKFVSDSAISKDFAESLKKFKYVEQKRSDLNAVLEHVQLKGKRVLVVDDGVLNLEVAKSMIEPYGITVDCVTGGQEAIERVRKAQPLYDAIFLTRWLPEMDGRKVVTAIRKDIGGEYSKSVPIIALTTNTLSSNINIFQEWGFQDVISKPLDIHLLDKIIRRWVGGETAS